MSKLAIRSDIHSAIESAIYLAVESDVRLAIGSAIYSDVYSAINWDWAVYSAVKGEIYE